MLWSLPSWSTLSIRGQTLEIGLFNFLIWNSSKYNEQTTALKILKTLYFSANKCYVCVQLQDNLKSQAIWLEENCLPLCLCYWPKNPHQWWLKKCLEALDKSINIFLLIAYDAIVVSLTSIWNAKYALVQRFFFCSCIFSCHYFFFSI